MTPRSRAAAAIALVLTSFLASGCIDSPDAQRGDGPTENDADQIDQDLVVAPLALHGCTAKGGAFPVLSGPLEDTMPPGFSVVRDGPGGEATMIRMYAFECPVDDRPDPTRFVLHWWHVVPPDWAAAPPGWQTIMSEGAFADMGSAPDDPTAAWLAALDFDTRTQHGVTSILSAASGDALHAGQASIDRGPETLIFEWAGPASPAAQNVTARMFTEIPGSSTASRGELTGWIDVEWTAHEALAGGVATYRAGTDSSGRPQVGMLPGVADGLLDLSWTFVAGQGAPAVV